MEGLSYGCRYSSLGFDGFMVISVLVLGGQAKAEEWKMEQGGIEPGKVMLGMRAGFAPLTQSLNNLPRPTWAHWSISRGCIASTRGY